MNKELISVVVPIYNVAVYLPKCLDSIIAQTYLNIEIILVDDGSLDDSGKICDEYATKDSRVKVFHIPNGGVAKARQLGVESSTGEYIVFVDPDDWLELDGIKRLYDETDCDIDIVRSSCNWYYEKDNSFKPRILENKIYLKDNYIAGIFIYIFTHAPWANLYKRGLFTEDSFPNAKRAQDLLMNVNIACKCNKVKAISAITYNYRDDSITTSRRSFINDYEFNYNLCKNMYDSLIHYNCYESVKYAYSIKVLNLIYGRILEINNNVYKDPLIHKIVSVLENSKPNLKIKLKIITIKYTSLRGMMRVLHSVKDAFKINKK